MFTRINRLRLAAGLACAALLAAAPAFAEPALWKVEGPHATVYLFGTVHILKPTVVWRSPKIEAAFKSSGTLYEEITNADDAAAAQPLVFKYGLDTAHTLSSKLDDAGKAKLLSVITPLGLQPAQVDPMRPWLAALTISILPIIKAGYDPKSGVDNLLKADAAAQGKPLQGFETLEQQVRFFGDLPQDLEVQYLLSTLDDAAKGTSDLDDLVATWAAGDVNRLETLLNADMKSQYPAIYKILLVDRNRAFADRIEGLLKGEGDLFRRRRRRAPDGRGQRAGRLGARRDQGGPAIAPPRPLGIRARDRTWIFTAF